MDALLELRRLGFDAPLILVVATWATSSRFKASKPARPIMS